MPMMAMIAGSLGRGREGRGITRGRDKCGKIDTQPRLGADPLLIARKIAETNIADL